jgi:DNA gyrase subunit A
MKMIEYFNDVLKNEDLRMEILKDDMKEMKEKYGDKRRTEIVFASEDISMEDMIADEAVVITISHLGYIKRTPLIDYRTQTRGGKGQIGSATRDEDFVEHLFVATNHNYILLFTEKGKCFWLRAFEIPEGTKTSKGRAIQNLINIPAEDKVKAFINVKDLEDIDYINNHFIVMCTKHGIIKKTTLEAYSRVRQNGINAININDGDQLIEARLTDGKNEILLANSSGRAIRFNESTVRPVGRNSIGVRGITLNDEEGKDDEVIGMVCIKDPKETILVVSQHGYGKRSDLEDYRVTNRGGKGVKTLNLTDKTGKLIAIKAVTETDDLMIINQSGITIRMSVADLRIMGRATQGVRLIRLNEDDQIASVSKVDEEDIKAVTDQVDEIGGSSQADSVDGNLSNTDHQANGQTDIIEPEGN